MISEQFSVVLVRPQYPFNIGAAARAMQNMGLERLILIAPACEIDVHAREGAASAQEVLARRVMYSSLENFYESEGEGLRIAFTRRTGTHRQVQEFQEFLTHDFIQKINAEWKSMPIYLLFGSEDDGLSSEELANANRFCSLPIYGPNGSYNLAQAVLITLFMIQSELHRTNLEKAQAPAQTVERHPLEYPKDTVELWLEATGFNLELLQRKNIATVLNSFFLRAVPTKEEMRLLSSVFFQNIRKLKEKNGKV